MKKGQITEVIIERVDYPNKGMGKVISIAAPGVDMGDIEKGFAMQKAAEEVPIVVKNAAPGQRVLARINKKRNGRMEAALLKVVGRGEGETDPPCPHFGDCGGCAWLTMDYSGQLAMKERQVFDVLNHAVDESAKKDWYEGIKPSPVTLGYRNKMEFTFGDEYMEGPLSLGLHRRGSFYDILTVDKCMLIHEDIRCVLRSTLDYFSARKISYFHRVRHEGYLRYLLVRRGTGSGEMLVDLVTSSQITDEEQLLEGWKELIKSLEDRLEGRIVGVLHTRCDSLSDAVKDEGTNILSGRDYFFEELMGLRFRISPFSFFQTNSEGARVLYETAREYANTAMKEMGERPVIYDLYSGTGTIAQMMAPVAKKVVGVEIVEEAVAAAAVNAALNGIDNCEFHSGDVLKIVPELTDKPDLIILDPPRDGCHPKALGQILSYNVPFIVYISCKVTSLARDLQLFQKAGYRLVRAVAIDQFPQTCHVEVVTLLQLSNRKPDAKIRIDIDLEDYYRIKDRE